MRFNDLHQDFLNANLEAIHSARTLLKARFLIEGAAHNLERALLEPKELGSLLQTAGKQLVTAGHYTSEGRTAESERREELITRIQTANQQLSELTGKLTSSNSTDPIPELKSINSLLKRLSLDIELAELERWGTLSALNRELTARIETLNKLIAASILLFTSVMLALGWALLRTKRIEDNLRYANEEIKAIQQTTLDASPMGIAYVDVSDIENQKILTVNSQMATLFGYSPESMTGLSVRRLYTSSEAYLRFANTAPARLANGETLREEIIMQRNDGVPFWCSLSVKAIDPENLSRVVWTCEHIAERKAYEAALQQERSKAEAANLAKSEFLANMSHELRTPFTGLFGLLDLLGQSSLDANQRRHLELAHSSAIHMQAIVNDILDFSKIEAGKLIIEQLPFRLQKAMRLIADFHTMAAERKGLRFVFNAEPLAVDTLIGDALRIRQIVENLLNNALKFTERGEIRLLVESVAETADEARVTISVEDTGIGIPPEKQIHIFEKFMQSDSSTTRVYGGTGLGLAICKRLTMMMGGELNLVSMEGQGSRFSLTLYLPINRFSTQHSTVSAERQIRLDGITILVAEDHPVNRSMIAESLELAGASVLTAENGEEAVRITTQEKPDIILMDCQMPIIDGLEATRRIRKLENISRHTPIIALTAFATTHYRDLCLAEGMMDRFMSKPLNMKELLASIQELAGPIELTDKPPEDTAAHHLARILLVDDNPPILEATRGLLCHLGYEVVDVGNGKIALDLLESDSNRFDLVLMDCQMPVLDGYETTRRWRAREKSLGRPPIAILAITADDRQSTRERCMAAGMNGTLIKPFDEHKLRSILEDWLH